MKRVMVFVVVAGLIGVSFLAGRLASDGTTPPPPSEIAVPPEAAAAQVGEPLEHEGDEAEDDLIPQQPDEDPRTPEETAEKYVRPSGAPACIHPAVGAQVVDCDAICRKNKACGTQKEDCDDCQYVVRVLDPNARAFLEQCILTTPCSEGADLGPLCMLKYLQSAPKASEAAERTCGRVAERAKTCNVRVDLASMCTQLAPMFTSAVIPALDSCSFASCDSFLRCVEGATCGVGVR